METETETGTTREREKIEMTPEIEKTKSKRKRKKYLKKLLKEFVPVNPRKSKLGTDLEFKMIMPKTGV